MGYEKDAFVKNDLDFLGNFRYNEVGETYE